VLLKDDAERRGWSRHLYGIDTSDASLYDMVLHIGKLSVDDASEMICNAALLPQFGTTQQSQQDVCDLALAAEVYSELLELTADVSVTAQGGAVTLTAFQPFTHGPASIQQFERCARRVPGVEQVIVNFRPLPLPETSAFIR
jgi:hypothetical protein